MQLRVMHVTGYQYDGKATASYNVARLTPRSSAEQIVVHARIDVSPTPYVQTYRDYFGTEVTAFEVLDPHEELTVTATSTVHTHRQPAAPPALGWADLAAPEVTDRHTEYLAINEIVEPAEDLARQVRELRSSYALPGEAARELCALVHREVAYETGSTEVETRAADAWEQRKVSARTSPTWSSAGCGRSASRRGTCRGTSTRCRPLRSARRYAASRTPGWSGGTTAGTASTPPTTRSRASGTSWSPRAATTATSSRSAASTPAARPRTCSSTCT